MRGAATGPGDLPRPGARARHHSRPRRPAAGAGRDCPPPEAGSSRCSRPRRSRRRGRSRPRRSGRAAAPSASRSPTPSRSRVVGMSVQVSASAGRIEIVPAAGPENASLTVAATWPSGAAAKSTSGASCRPRSGRRPRTPGRRSKSVGAASQRVDPVGERRRVDFGRLRRGRGTRPQPGRADFAFDRRHRAGHRGGEDRRPVDGRFLAGRGPPRPDLRPRLRAARSPDASRAASNVPPSRVCGGTGSSTVSVSPLSHMLDGTERTQPSGPRRRHCEAHFERRHRGRSSTRPSGAGVAPTSRRDAFEAPVVGDPGDLENCERKPPGPGEAGADEARPRRRDPARPGHPLAAVVRQAHVRTPGPPIFRGRRRAEAGTKVGRVAFGPRQRRVEFDAHPPAALRDVVGPRTRRVGQRPAPAPPPARSPSPRSAPIHLASLPCRPLARCARYVEAQGPGRPISPPSRPKSPPKPGRKPPFARMHGNGTPHA